MRAKKIVIKFVLIIFGVLVALIFLEGALRITNYNSGLKNYHQPDPILGHKGKPNLDTSFSIGWCLESRIITNSQGWRSLKNFSQNKPRNVIRIAVLGDSYVQGLQVDNNEIFTYLLEEKLNNNLGKNFEVYNFGISAYGTVREYLVLKEYVLDYKPDIVILLFYIGNDISDSGEEYEKYIMKINKKRILKSKLSILKTYQFIANDVIPKHPKLAKFLYNLGIMDTKINDPKNLPQGYYIYLDDYTPEVANNWKISLEYLSKMNSILDKNNITFIVVFFDAQDIIYNELYTELLEKYPNAKNSKFDKEKPSRILKIFLLENNISYLYLTEKFVERINKTGEKTYFPCDLHWNEIGHKWAAEEIYNYLIESGFIDF
jgi:hypothetical protein